MTALAEYLIKANLCLAGFYGLYYVLLRRHTFFALNRAYLLVAMLASFGLPLISLPEPVVETVALPTFTLPVTVTPTAPTGPTLEEGLLGAYGLGALVFLGLLAVSLWRLNQLIRSGTATRQSNHTLVLLADDRVAPFSFFRYLVMNQTDFAHNAEPIMGHELAHIRQWHSVDVLLAELVKVLCWPNPVAWLYKRSLQQVHEYLADQQAADKKQYARFLFDYAFQVEPNPLANSFFTPALLTQRIRMLYQSPTARRVLWRYALVLPLLAVLVGLTAAREPIAELIQASQPGKKITVSGRVVDLRGKAINGVTIYRQVPTGSLTTNTHGPIERTGGTIKTNAQGYFTLTGAEASGKLEFIHPDYLVTVVSIDRLRAKGQVLLVTKAQAMKIRNDNKTKEPLFKNKNKRMRQVGQQAISSTRSVNDSVLKVQNLAIKATFIGESINAKSFWVNSYSPEQSPNQPLVFIDGKAQSRDNDLHSINPKEIASITVLKGTSVQSTYGEKGKNGVIIITTKAK